MSLLPLFGTTPEHFASTFGLGSVSFARLYLAEVHIDKDSQKWYSTGCSVLTGRVFSVQ